MLDLTTRDPREVRALLEKLPDEAVGVLFVPRSQGLCEWANIDLDMRPMREQLMLGHLFILVVGQGPCHLLGQGAHLSGKGLPAIRHILRSQGARR